VTGDWTPPDIEGIEFRPSDHRRESFWCPAFDGGPNPEQACVLVTRD